MSSSVFSLPRAAAWWISIATKSGGCCFSCCCLHKEHTAHARITTATAMAVQPQEIARTAHTANAMNWWLSTAKEAFLMTAKDAPKAAEEVHIFGRGISHSTRRTAEMGASIMTGTRSRIHATHKRVFLSTACNRSGSVARVPQNAATAQPRKHARSPHSPLMEGQHADHQIGSLHAASRCPTM